MANEDSRENSVVGGALKVAAVVGAGALAVKGGRSLIKNYDDLGRTFGKAGDTVSKNISKGLGAFEKADGSGNVVKEGVDNLQSKILEKDYKKAFEKSTKIMPEANEAADVDKIREIRKDIFEDSHEKFKNMSPGEKRDFIDNEKSLYQKQREIIKTKAL